jgi:hypothetical protein
MSEAKSGAALAFLAFFPGYRFAHPGYDPSRCAASVNGATPSTLASLTKRQ